MQQADASQLDQLKQGFFAALQHNDFLQAARTAQRWHHARPTSAEPCYWLGYCLMRLNRHGDAEKALRLGLRHAPDSAECLSMLARALVMQRKSREGLEFADQAMAMDSPNPEVWDAIGVVYGQLNEFERARDVFLKIRKLKPGEARNLFNLAGMLNNCHDIEGAREAYLEALTLDPTKFISYFSLAHLQKATPERNDIDLLEDRFREWENNADARTYIGLALFRELEDLGEYGKAFKWLETGNAARREALTYSTGRDRKLFNTIRQTFDAAFCSAQDAGHQSDEPIFVLGMPRTGTTLLERIISVDESVFAAGELQDFFGAWNHMAAEAGAGKTAFDIIAAGTQLDMAELGRRYIENTRPRTGHTPRFIDKLPNNFMHIGAIAKALPGARIIHLTRNPMDTCFSNLKQLFGASACPYSYTQEEVAAYYLLYRDLMDHWHEVLPGRILDVAYEDLVQHTEREARRVYDFLGLEWTGEALLFHKRKAPVGTASTAQVRQPVYTSSLEKWRRYETQLAPMAAVLKNFV